MTWNTLILDLDGTVYVDGIPIADVVDRLNSFQEAGNRVLFMSNNTSFSTKIYYQKLRGMGLNVEKNSILTPVFVAGKYLKSKYSKGYVVGTKALVAELEELFEIRQESENPEFVLVAFDSELTYEKLKKACQHINKGIPYYVTHIDLACPSAGGPIPDCGSISLLIKTVTQKDAVLDFGKPSDRLVKYIQGILGEYLATDILMVGDRLYTDIALGNKLGVETLVVFSGEAKLEHLRNDTLHKPTYYANTLPEFLASRNIGKKTTQK